MYSLIHKKIDEINNKEKLFKNGDSILVALSGGADSVALLLAMKEFYPDVSLYACHVNHMLRGDESDRDMEFVKSLCDNIGVHTEVLKTDVGAYAKEQGLSTELAARNIRYDFFAKVCKKLGIKKVATAHTLSDNAETVLFNLARGTGISGLCGIPAIRELTDDISIIRPLLFINRCEIEEYLRKKKQPYMTDSTNLTDDYTRNYFRHRIMPLFKQVNPSFEGSLKNTCNTLKDAQIFIDKSVNNNKCSEIKKLAELDDCILHRVIIELYKENTNCTTLENVHVKAIASLIRSHANGISNAAEVCLPGSVSAVADGGKLTFVPTIRNINENSTSYHKVLGLGLNILDGTDFAVFISEYKNSDIPVGYKLYSEYEANKTIISGNLVARSRNMGDSVVICGMTKKVKALFTQNKTESRIRSSLPFICDDNGILIIPGICVSDKLKSKITDENNILYIYVYSKTTL